MVVRTINYNNKLAMKVAYEFAQIYNPGSPLVQVYVT